MYIIQRSIVAYLVRYVQKKKTAFHRIGMNINIMYLQKHISAEQLSTHIKAQAADDHCHGIIVYITIMALHFMYVI